MGRTARSTPHCEAREDARNLDGLLLYSENAYFIENMRVATFCQIYILYMAFRKGFCLLDLHAMLGRLDRHGKGC